jgi:hypothetical protein
LQNDDYAVNARRLTKLVLPLSSDDPATSQGLTVLKNWDYRETADSAAAALFEVICLAASVTHCSARRGVAFSFGANGMAVSAATGPRFLMPTRLTA